MIRIKLIFDDNILITEEYRKIWFLIPETVQYVSDLVYLIKTKFSLKNASTKGLYLVLDEFTLPPTQNIQLIRENDVILVKNNTVQNKHSASIAAQSSSSSESSEESDSSASRHETTDHNQHTRAEHKPVSHVSDVSSDSSESDSNHVTITNTPSRAVTDTKQKQSQRSATNHVTAQSQRRGASLGRGYRAPQWPWLPFTVASSDTCHTSHVTAQSSVSLTALQREDVIAFKTMELDGWQPVLSPVKQATVRAVTPHSVTVRLLTGVTDEADDEVTLAAEDLIDLTVVNKHS